MRTMLGAEWLKLRRSGMLWIAGLAPFLLGLQGVVNFMHYRNTVFASSKRTEWEILYEQCVILYGMLLLPLLITVLVALLARIENQQNGWKHLLSLPVSRKHVYVVKLIVACMLVALTFIVLFGTMVAGGMLVGVKGDVPYELIGSRGILGFAVSLPIVAIQFVMSMRFANVGVPLVLGTGLSVPTLFAANSKIYWICDPWTYPTMVLFAPIMKSLKKVHLCMG